jgi:uncharacterized membrane protein YqhA
MKNILGASRYIVILAVVSAFTASVTLLAFGVFHNYDWTVKAAY